MENILILLLRFHVFFHTNPPQKLSTSLTEAISMGCLYVISDSTFGAISMVPNVMKRFGWNPANKFLNVLKQIMEENTGNPNITFREVCRSSTSFISVFCHILTWRCAQKRVLALRAHIYLTTIALPFHPAYMFHRWVLVVMLLYCFYLYLIEY